MSEASKKGRKTTAARKMIEKEAAWVELEVKEQIHLSFTTNEEGALFLNEKSVQKNYVK